ncbi:phage protease [Sphingomonas canadensis]|uniref:Phage protease n=1 Tax=Sphingomonas canadensis TaxID=1219257 RepID=A0ABW3H4A1_9SPHN|nr:phage protease [Sphingomonas canadensis]MCW3835978.1 phage protease [Sphingomonas canadensis]
MRNSPLALIAAAARPAGTVQAVAASSEIELVDGKAPTRIKLLPMGEIAMRDGRGPYRIRDLAHAQAIVAACRQFFGQADMPGDYNHSMQEPAARDGGRAPASAWVRAADLTAEPDGIWANNVRWTPAAAAAIEASEYRYISPLFLAKKPKDGGDVVLIKNFALVGTGAIIDLPAIAAGLSGEDQDMDLTAIAAALGLAPDASVEAIAAAIEDLKAGASQVAVAAGLAATAGAEEVAAAVTTLKASGKPDPAKFVPIAQFESVTAQLGVLNGERAEREVAAAMSPEIGKVTPAMKDWALDYFRADEAGFRKWLEAAPRVVAAGSVLAGGKPAAGGEIALTPEEIAACARHGWNEAEYLAEKKELLA